MPLKSLIRRRLVKGFYFRITIPWPEGPARDKRKGDAVNIFQKIKEMLAWRNLLPFLKLIFKGLLLILVSGLKDLAIEAAKEVASKGLPDDETKRKEFERIMRQKAQEKGIEIGGSALNLLRELAVQYWKQNQ